MRLLIVALLATSAFAARDSSRWSSQVLQETLNKADSFKQGMEYRFHLDSQVSNGLPVPGSEQAAMRTQSLVSLSFPESETVAHLRIEKIRVATLQKEVAEPKNIQPFELFEEIEITEENLRQLRLPLRFRYESGVVSEIEFDREDSEWSKNIKRVYLNMLQVNLSQQNVEKLSERDVYSPLELTLEGECEVTYTVLPESTENKSEKLVTKSINFDRCNKRVGQKIPMLFPNGEMPTKRFEDREIESSTLFNYRLVGSESRFLIKEVELRSVYVYSPLSKEDALFTTFVSGKMSLLEVTEDKKRIAAPKSDKKESLLHSMEWEKKEEKFLATGDESLLKNSPYPVMKNKPEVVARLVKSLLSHMESEEKGIELAATHEMGRIVVLLRQSTKEEIKKMHNEICEDAQMKDLFMDALALAGSYNTVEHLLEKIRSHEVSPIRAALLLKQLSRVPAPSKEIVRSLVSLCKDNKKNPLERQACWLTVGSVMNGVCGDVVDVEEMCPRDVKEDFVRELTKQYEQAETRYEKILALKSLSNSGMDLIVFPLEKIIRDERVETVVRIHAVEALRRLRNVMPRKMVSILLPLFKNTYERPELRVAAFHQIMQTLPEKTVIHQIVAQLENEPSNQVYSFVYETLEQFSRSELPKEKKMAEDITASLRTIRNQDRKMSTFKRFAHYNEKHQSGASLNWGALFSNDSVLPKEVKSSLETTFAGNLNKHLGQVGFSQQNLDSELYKLIETFDEALLEDILVRGKRSTTVPPTEALRSLFSSLSIHPRKHSAQEPHAIAYMRVGDMDRAFVPLESDVITEALKSFAAQKGRINIDQVEKFLAKGLKFNTVMSANLYEHKRTLVHSMGMPLTYSASMPVQFKIEGELKVEVQPKNGKSVDGLKMKLIARPTFAATHVTKVEIMNPLVNFGIKLLHSVQANLPMDITTHMSWDDKFEIRHILVLPKESTRLMQLQTRPVSFVRVWPKETRTYVQPKEKTIYVEQLETLVKKIEESYLEKATGIKLNVVGHVHGHVYEAGSEGIPAALLIGENNVEVAFERTAETPKEYIIRAEMDLFKKAKSEKIWTMDKFFQKNNEKHFETELADHETQYGRRHAFSRYVESYGKYEESEGKSDEEYDEESYGKSGKKLEGKAYAHSLIVDISSNGGLTSKTHKASLEMRSVCDEPMRHCVIRAHGLRTPVTEAETSEWKFDWKMEMLYPKMPKTLKALFQQRHREVAVNMETRWGCAEEKNEVMVKIQGEQNQEQKKWMEMISEMKDMTPMEEHNRLIEASMLNQYKAVVEYDIKSPVSYGLINRFYSTLKADLPFTKTWIERNVEEKEKNVVLVQLTLEPTSENVNLTIQTPFEKVMVREIATPLHNIRLNIRREPTSPIRNLRNLGSSVFEETKAKCVVESDRIRSFDDVIYRTPLTTCYSVLAKDCSSEEPKFAVLIKKINKRSEEKKMKIISKKSVIELEMDKESEKMLVRVNGEEVARQDFESAGVYNKNEFVMVRLDGVTVEFDGYTANVKLSEYYKNKQCGICGHFDGEKKTEFRRADNEETEDLEEFHRSFLVKGDECEIEEQKLSEKRNYRIESDEVSSEEESIFETKWDKKSSKKNVEKKNYVEESEVVEPVMKTRVIEYSNQVCFSMKPLPECPKKTVENKDDLKNMEVAFACLFHSDRSTSRLVREARREVLNIDNFPESFTKKFEVPRTCVAY